MIGKLAKVGYQSNPIHMRAVPGCLPRWLRPPSGARGCSYMVEVERRPRNTPRALLVHPWRAAQTKVTHGHDKATARAREAGGHRTGPSTRSRAPKRRRAMSVHLQMPVGCTAAGARHTGAHGSWALALCSAQSRGSCVRAGADRSGGSGRVVGFGEHIPMGHAWAPVGIEHVHLAWSRLQDELEVGVVLWCVARSRKRKACHMYVSMSVISF